MMCVEQNEAVNTLRQCFAHLAWTNLSTRAATPLLAARNAATIAIVERLRLPIMGALFRQEDEETHGAQNKR